MTQDSRGQDPLQLAANIHRMMRSFDSHTPRRERAACAKEKQKLAAIWAARHDVKPSRGSADWWGKLIKNISFYSARSAGLPEQLPSDDHTSLWIKHGRPHFWVSQPYGLKLREMIAAAEKFGIKFEIETFPSWYYPANTHLVVWSRNESS
jgi:hypothetical protein